MEAGKRELAEGKKEYKQAKDNLFVVLVDKLLQGGKGFKGASKQIAEGDKQVAKGDGQVMTLPQSGRLDGCEQPQGLPG